MGGVSSPPPLPPSLPSAAVREALPLISLSLAVDGCAVRSSVPRVCQVRPDDRRLTCRSPPQGKREGRAATWATLLKRRENTLLVRVHPSVRPSAARAVFSNGQSGVNYPTEKAPADAIGWEIKALTSQSVSRSLGRSDGVRLLGYCPDSPEPRLRTPIQTGKISCPVLVIGDAAKRLITKTM